LIVTRVEKFCEKRDSSHHHSQRDSSRVQVTKIRESSRITSCISDSQHKRMIKIQSSPYNSSATASFKIIINNHNISHEDNLKYVGVLLNNKLSWKPHLQKVKTQLSRTCGVLSKLKHYTTLPVLKVVYKSLIHPYLHRITRRTFPALKHLILPKLYSFSAGKFTHSYHNIPRCPS